VYTPQGVPVTRFMNLVSGDAFPDDPPRRGRVECLIPRVSLNVGTYVYNLLAEIGTDYEIEDFVQAAGGLVVEQGDFYGTGRLIDPRFPALVEHRWKLEAL
jgi:lipopolysaccharide transport system ATP-binding protein